MTVTIDHVALMVSDLERSREFYCDLLGLEVVSPEEHNDGPISEMVAMERVHMREYRLRAPGGVNGHTRSAGQGFTFDLIQWIHPESPVGRVPIHHVPSAHICFGVEDVPATWEKLRAAGVEIVSPPVRFEGEGEWHVLFFYDPDGNLLELNEIGTGQQVPHDFDWTEA
ncbi:MAG: VOC family protein [Anaerolineaceae bacterium]|nr:VOC family protein [Anaerolineaceae bacterium]MDE0327620.1 VOC family protein [Anaerolineaceae bacterium]MDE0610741.1 VOC family protein [Anaerolineaceae bacterium]